MVELPERDVQKNHEVSQKSRDIHENFRPGSESSREASLAAEKEKAAAQAERARTVAMGSKFQGDIGEGITLRVATEKLDLTPDERFDQAGHGFDAVFRDDQGHLVVVESKFDGRGIKALEKNQMQPEWVENNAKMMQDPSNERYTDGNAEIGREIQRKGAENIRRIVVTTNPGTLEVQAYEGQKDGSWKPIMGKWSAIDLEQPYLK
jgi:hypothetical protein